MRPLDGHYFRRHGLRVPLPGLPGSTEFNEAYAQALDEAPAPAVIGASRTIPGSVNAMIVGYLGSAAFHHLAPSSQPSMAASLRTCAASTATRASPSWSAAT